MLSGNAINNLWFLPIIVLVVQLLIFGFLGYKGGIKVSFVFFSMNILVWILSFFVSEPIYKNFLEKIIESKFFKYIINYIEIEKDDWKELFHLFIFLFFSILGNLISFCIFLVFRKKLLRSMRNRKAIGKSNVYAGIVGSAIFIAGIIPFAIVISSLTSIYSMDEQVNLFFDKMASKVLFGKIGSISIYHKYL